MVSRISTMIMGLLAEGERHGYELVREMDERGLRRWTRASGVAVYKALARLEEQGCLTSWTEKGGNKPDRRMYALTARGGERLRDDVYALCAAREPLRLESCVGIAFIERLDAVEAHDALETRQRYMEEQARRLQRELEMVDGLVSGVYTEILRHELAAYRDEARWLKRLASAIAVRGGRREAAAPLGKKAGMARPGGR